MKITKVNIKAAKQVVKQLRKAIRNNTIVTEKDFYEITGIDTILGKLCETARTDPKDALTYDCRRCIFSYGHHRDEKGLYCITAKPLDFGDYSQKAIRAMAKKFLIRLNKLIADYYREIQVKE